MQRAGGCQREPAVLLGALPQGHLSLCPLLQKMLCAWEALPLASLTLTLPVYQCSPISVFPGDDYIFLGNKLLPAVLPPVQQGRCTICMAESGGRGPAFGRIGLHVICPTLSPALARLIAAKFLQEKQAMKREKH